MRVHQDERPEGSVGSVVIGGRRRRPAAQGRRTARAGTRGAGERAAPYNNLTPEPRLIPPPIAPSPSAQQEEVRIAATEEPASTKEPAAAFKKEETQASDSAAFHMLAPRPHVRLDAPPNLLNLLTI